MLKSYRFWIGLIVSVISLYFAFQGINLAELGKALTRFNWWWLVPAYLAFVLSYVGRIYRWQLLFTPIHVRWRDVLSALSIGYFLSGVFPARLGDPVRAYLISTHDHVGIGRGLSSVVIERLTDGLSIVLFLALLLPIVPNVPMQARTGGMVAALAGIGAVIILYLISWQRERGMKFLRALTPPFQPLQHERLWHFIESLLDGLSILRETRPLFGVVAWSLIVWIFAAVLNWTIMPAMGLTLGLDAATLVLVVTALVVIVPSSPGYFGIFHVVTRTTLEQVYGASPTDALAYAVVLHAFVYLNLIALGLFFIWREGLNLGQLRKIETTTENVTT